jgi:hypothetical protein
MATALDIARAARKHKPSIVANKAYTPTLIVRQIAQRTELPPATIKQVLDAHSEVVRQALAEGAPIPLANAGNLSIRVKGWEKEFSASFRVSRKFTEELNENGFFRGNIENEKNFGKSAQDFAK